MKYIIGGEIFSSSIARPLAIESGSLFLITTPIAGVENSVYEAIEPRDNVTIVNSATEAAYVLKVGAFFNSGRIDCNRYNKLLKNFDLTDNCARNFLTGFKLTLMVAYVNCDLIIMTTVGLSKDSVCQVIYFLQDLLAKSPEKTALVVHQTDVAESIDKKVCVVDLTKNEEEAIREILMSP